MQNNRVHNGDSLKVSQWGRWHSGRQEHLIPNHIGVHAVISFFIMIHCSLWMQHLICGCAVNSPQQVFTHVPLDSSLHPLILLKLGVWGEIFFPNFLLFHAKIDCQFKATNHWARPVQTRKKNLQNITWCCLNCYSLNVAAGLSVAFSNQISNQIPVNPLNQKLPVSAFKLCQ